MVVIYEAVKHLGAFQPKCYSDTSDRNPTNCQTNFLHFMHWNETRNFEI